MVLPFIAIIIILIVLFYAISAGKDSDDETNDTDGTGTSNSQKDPDINSPDTDWTSIKYENKEEKRQAGPTATDVTAQGRKHSVTITDVKADGAGVASFHGLTIFITTSETVEDYDVGDKVKIEIADVANNHAKAVPIKQL